MLHPHIVERAVGREYRDSGTDEVSKGYIHKSNENNRNDSSYDYIRFYVVYTA